MLKDVSGYIFDIVGAAAKREGRDRTRPHRPVFGPCTGKPWSDTLLPKFRELDAPLSAQTPVCCLLAY